MKRIARALLWAALAVGLGAPAGAAAPASAAHAAPFLFEVTGPQARHYLLGSVHLLPPTATPPPALDAAYAATRVLVVETDLDALATPELQAQMIVAAREERPGGLKARIGRKLYDKLQKRARQLGIPYGDFCATSRAWFCALTLELHPLQQAEFSIAHGIDRRYYTRAREDGRSVVGLESPEFQINLFAQMPDALSKQMLAATVEERTQESQSPEELLRVWRTGDLTTLDEVVRDMKKRYPELYARVLSDRTRAWVAPLADFLKRDVPVLIVVGAAHLPGSDGLLALLREQGFEVKPVPPQDGGGQSGMMFEMTRTPP